MALFKKGFFGFSAKPKPAPKPAPVREKVSQDRVLTAEGWRRRAVAKKAKRIK